MVHIVKCDDQFFYVGHESLRNILWNLPAYVVQNGELDYRAIKDKVKQAGYTMPISSRFHISFGFLDFDQMEQDLNNVPIAVGTYIQIGPLRGNDRFSLMPARKIRYGDTFSFYPDSEKSLINFFHEREIYSSRGRRISDSRIRELTGLHPDFDTLSGSGLILLTDYVDRESIWTLNHPYVSPAVALHRVFRNLSFKGPRYVFAKLKEALDGTLPNELQDFHVRFPARMRGAEALFRGMDGRTFKIEDIDFINKTFHMYFSLIDAEKEINLLEDLLENMMQIADEPYRELNKKVLNMDVSEIPEKWEDV